MKHRKFFAHHCICSLRSFATDWKQARQVKDVELRQKLLLQRSVFIDDGNITPTLETVLDDIFSSYSQSKSAKLNQIEASQLWYQSGMKLTSLETIMQTKGDTPTVEFKDFLDLLKMVIQDEEESLEGQEPYIRGSTVFQVSTYMPNINPMIRRFMSLTKSYLLS